MGTSTPARIIFQQADLAPKPTLAPRLDNPQESFARLERAIYGPFLPPQQFEQIGSEILADKWLSVKATVERREYRVTHGRYTKDIEIVFVTPNSVTDAPLIISQNFSSNRSVIAKNGTSPLAGEPQNFGVMEGVFTFFFGRHIVEPPLEDIIDAGYGFIALHPPDYVADRANTGEQQLNSMLDDRTSRPGALMIWASLTTALAEQLKAENPTQELFAYGHSRYGKTALLAGAKSENIDGVIAHQSGTAGASLMRDEIGESLEDVIKFYPHWLSPKAIEYAVAPKHLPSDAHSLIASISKPILLGNARRDVWSDPEGAFRAAHWAAKNTDQSFTAQRLNELIPTDDIAFWVRPGTHGVTKEDWSAFLFFLDAHTK